MGAGQEQARSRRTRASGDQARARILEHAAELATIEGLEGLSIGRLAEVTGLAKSSVHALFGSKEQLQLATIDTARDSFVAAVVTPALATTESGLERLAALCDGYLDYVEGRVFPGGCFFVGLAAEVGARPGRVHDVVAEVQGQWRDLLVSEARSARDNAELAEELDPAQLAFELGVILAGTNLVTVLHDDDRLIGRARAAVRGRLRA